MRELRQNLSRYLDRVKDGESLEVTEHGRLVARLSPASQGPYAEAVEKFGVTVPTARLEDVLAALPSGPGFPAGTADSLLAEGREGRF